MTSAGDLDEAQSLIQKGHYKDAIVLLEKQLEKDERDPNVNFLLAQAYEKLGDHSNAILYARRILKFGRYNQNVNEIVVRTHLAHSLEKNGNFNEAKNEFLILTTIEPTNIEHFYNAGRLLYRAKLYQNSMNVLKQGLQLNSKHFPTLTTLGKACFHLKFYTEAKNYLEKAKEINPHDSENLYYLAQTLRYLGEFQKAIQYLDIVEKDSKLKSRALLLKGIILIDTESFSQGIMELEKASGMFPKGTQENLLTHYYIALAAEKLKNIEKALEHWEYIHSTQPDYKDVKAKLKQYSDFKTSDIIKDILTSNRVQFETLFRKIIEKLNYKALSLNVDSDSTITAVCSNYANPQYKTNSILIRLYREMKPVSESQVREFHEAMKMENAYKGIYMCVSDFHPKAIEYCSNRPIDLYNANSITKLFENKV